MLSSRIVVRAFDGQQRFSTLIVVFHVVISTTSGARCSTCVGATFMHTLVFPIFCVLVSTCLGASLTSIHPRAGGVKGGTAITIDGADFPEEVRSLRIVIGDATHGSFLCDPIPARSTKLRLVCLTPEDRGLRGKFPLSVVLENGTLATCAIASGCFFNVNDNKNAKITSVQPKTVTDKTTVTVTGERLLVTTSGDGENEQTTVKIGDDERANVKPGASSSHVHLTADAGDSPVPGVQSISVNQQETGTASSLNVRVTVVPTITYVHPVRGSTAGGQRVTVHGNAFGRNVTRLTVSIHGSPCRVVDLTNRFCVCVTSSHRHTVPPRWRARAGFGNASFPVLADGWLMEGTCGTTVSMIAGEPRYQRPEVSRRQTTFCGDSVFGQSGSAATRFTTLFTPTISGNYTFDFKSDDNGELWLSNSANAVPWVESELDPRLRRRIVTSSVNAYSASTQRAVVSLEAGVQYWMRAIVVNSQGPTGCALRVSRGDVVVYDTDAPVDDQRTLLEPHDPRKAVVKVTVGSIPAVLGSACLPFGNCTYQYSNGHTGVVLSVAPRRVSGSRHVFTITGRRFSHVADDMSVTVGDIPCHIASSTPNRIVCRTHIGVPAGHRFVRVHMAGSGKCANTPRITSSPTLVSAQHEGSLVTIVGTGFGVDAQHLQVTVADVECSIQQVANNFSTPTTTASTPECQTAEEDESRDPVFDRVVCQLPRSAALGNESFSVQVRVRGESRHMEQNAAVFNAEDAPALLGQSQAMAAPTLEPRGGSVWGSTMLTITVPGRAFDRGMPSTSSSCGASLSDVNSLLTVSIGHVQCRVIYAFDSQIKCLTRRSNRAGLHAVIVMFDGAEIQVGSFTYREQITDVWPRRMSPLGGNTIAITTSALPQPNAQHARVTYAGVPCDVMSRTAQSVVCTMREVPPLPSETENPVLERFSHTDATVRQRLFIAPDASVEEGGFSISPGAFVSSRRNFGRSIAVTASLMPLESAAKDVRLQALIDDPSSHSTGFTAFCGYRRHNGVEHVAHCGIQVNMGHATRKEHTTVGVTFAAGRWNQWRLEVLETLVRFTIDGHLVGEIERFGDLVGNVGFVSTSQTYMVRDIVIEDLSHHRLLVDFGRGALQNVHSRAPYVAANAPSAIHGVMPVDSVKPNDVVTIVGSFFWDHWTRHHDMAYVFPSHMPAAQHTPALEGAFALCSERALTSRTVATCTIAENIPAGSYVLRYKTYYGFATSSRNISLGVTTTVIAPTTIAPSGGLVTIKGAGFSTNLSESTVTVGNHPCEVTDANQNFVRCRLVGPLTDGASMKVQLIHRGVVVDMCVCPEIVVSGAEAHVPVVTRVSTTISDARWSIRLDGSNLGPGEVVVDGGFSCRIHSQTAARVYCRIFANGFDVPRGLRNVTFHVNDRGFATFESSSSVNFVEGINGVAPYGLAAGAASHGAELTMDGWGFRVPHGADVVVVERTDFRRTATGFINGWYLSPSAIRDWTVGDSRLGRVFGGIGNFGEDDTLSKTVTALPAHSHVVLRIRLVAFDGPWWDDERLWVEVDGRRHTFSFHYARCIGRIFDISPAGNRWDDCVLDTPFVVPHTAASVRVKVGYESYFHREGHSWGIVDSHVSVVPAATSLRHNVSVSGAPCVVQFMHYGKLRCRVEGNVSAGTHDVVATGGRYGNETIACNGRCRNVPAADSSEPAATLVGFSTAQSLSPKGSRVAKELDFTFRRSITVEQTLSADSSVFTLSKVREAGTNWHHGLAASSQLIERNSGLIAIEFDANPTARFMVGFRDGSRVPRRSGYQDIDFAIYNELRSPVVFESGRHMARSRDTTCDGGKLRLSIDPVRNSITYEYNGVVIHQSHRELRWPLMVRVAIHTAGASITGFRLVASETDDSSRLVPLVIAGPTIDVLDEWDHEATNVVINGSPVAIVARVNRRQATVLVNTSVVGALTLGQNVSIAVSNMRGTGAATTLQLRPIVAEVEIVGSAGSVHGGQLVTIRGSGFSPDSTTVVMGANHSVCDIRRVLHAEIICVAPPLEAGPHAVMVHAAGVESACLDNPDPWPFRITDATIDACPSYTTEAGDVTPVLTSVEYSAMIATGVTITVYGANLDVSGSITVADGMCNIKSGNATQLICEVAGYAGGSASIRVATDAGFSNTYDVEVAFFVNSTEQLVVGTLGGATLELLGDGFGRTANVSIVDASDRDMCTSITRESAQQVICTLMGGEYATSTSADLQLVIGDARLPIGLLPNGEPRIVSSTDSTPQVHSVTPDLLAYGDVAVLEGKHLEGATRVHIHTASRIVECEVIDTTATEIACRVDGHVPGTPASNISVYTSDRGDANCTLAVRGELTVERVEPPQLKAGSRPVIVGSGFVDGSPEDFEVVIGGHPCTVVNVSEDRLECVMPHSGITHIDATVGVQITRRERDADTNVSSTLAYTASNCPVITSLEPDTVSAAGGNILTLHGVGFDSKASSNFVRVEGHLCRVIFGTTSEIRCVVPALGQPNENTTVALRVNGVEAAPWHVHATLRVTSVACHGCAKNADGFAVAGTEGGSTLRLHGSGFPAGEDFGIVSVRLGGLPCRVTHVNHSLIECVVAPAARAGAITRPELSNTYVMRTSSSHSITVRVNGTVAVVDEDSSSVDFSSSVTPTIERLMVVNRTSCNRPGLRDVAGPGAHILIRGRNFLLTGNSVELRRPGGAFSATCTVVAENTENITCSVPMAPRHFGEHTVHVFAGGRGQSQAARTCPPGAFLMCDGRCLFDANCTVAAWGIFRDCQGIADVVTHDGFCHSNGGTDRIGRAMRLDSGLPFDMNCYMYGCEGGDCDSSVTLAGRSAVISTCKPDPNGQPVALLPMINRVMSHESVSSTSGGLRLMITAPGIDEDEARASVGAVPCQSFAALAPGVFACETGAAVHAPDAQLQFHMSVDGVAACCNTMPSKNTSTCGNFSYSEVVAPVLGEVLSRTRGPSSPPVAVCSPGSPVVVSASGFGDDVSGVFVSINGHSGEILSLTSESVEFVCPLGPGQGEYDAVLRRAGVGNALTTLRVWYEPTITSISQNVSSAAGGATFTVQGSAFSSAAFALVEPLCPLTILSLSTTEAVVRMDPDCEEPYTTDAGAELVLHGPAPVVPTTCAAANGCRVVSTLATTPSIDSMSVSATTVTLQLSLLGATDVNVTLGRLGPELAILESNATHVVASLPHAYTVGTYTLTVVAHPYGWARAAVSTNIDYDLAVSDVSPTEGSVAGGQLLTVVGTGFSTAAVVQLNSTSCTVLAANNTVLVVRTPRLTEGNYVLSVTVQSGPTSYTEIAEMDYMRYSSRDNLTPIISSVEPSQGSTEGGTLITLHGTMLRSDMTVTLAGTECAVETSLTDASDGSRVYCTSGRRGVTAEDAVVVVATSNNTGYADSHGVTYSYIDLWSRWTTWGNRPPPIAGDSAVLSEGQTVLLDVSPPRLHLLLVMGHLKFDRDVDGLTLEATYIMVHHGRLTVGTADAPFMKRATIRLFGDRLTPEIPLYGAKTLAVRDGALDLHGETRQPTWTSLVENAQNNTREIIVRGPVDWRVGERIVIASTDFHQEHAEERVIVCVFDGSSSRVRITFDRPLEFYHHGTRECFRDGFSACVGEIAEVGLLSRNVVVEGDPETSQSNGFGATLSLMPRGNDASQYARISGVEFRHVGQRYVEGRHPILFTMSGVSTRSYIRGVAVHRSLNRGIVIQGTDNLTVADNVVYRVQGHAIMLVDGSESYNAILRNLVLTTDVTTSNLNTDMMPASLYLGSPTNDVVGNHAAGSDGFGIWLAPAFPYATGPSGSPSIRPFEQGLLGFWHNVAHSNSLDGLNVFRIWRPREQQRVSGLTCYKNKRNGVSVARSLVGQIGSVKFDGLTLADNGEDQWDAAAFWVYLINAANMTMGLQNSLLIAHTSNQPHHRLLERRGVNLPANDNFFIENVTFVNYGNENWAIEPTTWAREYHWWDVAYGWEVVVMGLSWIASPHRIRFRFRHHAVINDVGGSVLGFGVTAQLLPEGPLYHPQRCISLVPLLNTSYPAVMCGASDTVRRFETGYETQRWGAIVWEIDGRSETLQPSEWYVLIAPINRRVDINFSWAFNPDSWSWFWFPRYSLPTERMLYATVYQEPRHAVYATFNRAQSADLNAEPTLNGNASAFFHQRAVGPDQFAALVHMPNYQLTVTAQTCPDTGCIAPAPPSAEEKACSPWNEPSSWLSGAVPAPFADVVIDYRESICLDSAAALSVGSLTIQGTLELMDDNCPASGQVTLVVARWIHVDGGRLVLGNLTNPLVTCRATITLGPINFGFQDEFHLLPWGTRSITLESGEVVVSAQTPSPLSCRLAAPIVAGETTLVVDNAMLMGWSAGDEIVVSSTARHGQFREGRELAERRTISQVVGSTITVTSAFGNDHFGRVTPYVLNGTFVTASAVVAIVSRRVLIQSGGHNSLNSPPFEQGWQLNVGCTPANLQGCATRRMHSAKTGLLHLHGARLVNMGQGRSEHGGVELDGVISPLDNNTANGTVIASCFFETTWNTAIAIRHTTRGVVVANNTLYNVQGDGIRAFSEANTIDGNVLLDVRRSRLGCAGAFSRVGAEDEECWVGALRIAANNTLTRNIVAGAAGAGIITDGDSCDSSSGEWHSNDIQAGRDGVLVYEAPVQRRAAGWPSTAGASCKWLRGVLVHNCQDNGIALWYVEASMFRIAHVIVANNLVGILPIIANRGVDVRQPVAPQFVVQDSIVAGRWPDHVCSRSRAVTCRQTLLGSFAWCTTFTAGETPIENVGVMSVTFATFMQSTYRTAGMSRNNWAETDNYLNLRGTAMIENVAFDNFYGNTSDCTGDQEAPLAGGIRSVALFQNMFSNDTFYRHSFRRVSWGSGVAAGGEFYARTTYGDIPQHTTVGEQTRWLDFDNSRFGPYWPDAPHKIWLADLDGSFTRSGHLTHVLSSQTLMRRGYTARAVGPWNGTGLGHIGDLGDLRDGCASRSAWRAVACSGSDVKLVTLAVEHLGEDRLLRHAGPVVLCSGNGRTAPDGVPRCIDGQMDFASGPYMKGAVHRATLRRMPRWRFVVEHGGNYTLYFRGVPPALMRIRLLDDDYLSTELPGGVAAGVTVNIRYFGPNAESRVGVFVDRRKQRSVAYRGDPWDVVPAVAWPSAVDPAGTHFHNKKIERGVAVNVLSLALRGHGTVMTLKQEPIVVLQMRLAIPLESFFEQRETFAIALASVLGISSSRIRFVEIVAGSENPNTASRAFAAQATTTSVRVEIEPEASEAEDALDDESVNNNNATEELMRLQETATALFFSSNDGGNTTANGTSFAIGDFTVESLSADVATVAVESDEDSSTSAPPTTEAPPTTTAPEPTPTTTAAESTTTTVASTTTAESTTTEQSTTAEVSTTAAPPMTTTPVSTANATSTAPTETQLSTTSTPAPPPPSTTAATPSTNVTTEDATGTTAAPKSTLPVTQTPAPTSGAPTVTFTIGDGSISVTRRSYCPMAEEANVHNPFGMAECCDDISLGASVVSCVNAFESCVGVVNMTVDATTHRPVLADEGSAPAAAECRAVSTCAQTYFTCLWSGVSAAQQQSRCPWRATLLGHLRQIAVDEAAYANSPLEAQCESEASAVLASAGCAGFSASDATALCGPVAASAPQSLPPTAGALVADAAELTLLQPGALTTPAHVEDIASAISVGRNCSLCSSCTLACSADEHRLGFTTLHGSYLTAPPGDACFSGGFDVAMCSSRLSAFSSSSSGTRRQCDSANPVTGGCSCPEEEPAFEVPLAVPGAGELPEVRTTTFCVPQGGSVFVLAADGSNACHSSDGSCACGPQQALSMEVAYLRSDTSTIEAGLLTFCFEARTGSGRVPGMESAEEDLGDVTGQTVVTALIGVAAGFVGGPGALALQAAAVPLAAQCTDEPVTSVGAREAIVPVRVNTGSGPRAGAIWAILILSVVVVVVHVAVLGFAVLRIKRQEDHDAVLHMSGRKASTALDRRQSFAAQRLSLSQGAMSPNFAGDAPRGSVSYEPSDFVRRRTRSRLMSQRRMTASMSMAWDWTKVDLDSSAELGGSSAPQPKTSEAAFSDLGASDKSPKRVATVTFRESGAFESSAASARPLQQATPFERATAAVLFPGLSLRFVSLLHVGLVFESVVLMRRDDRTGGEIVIGVIGLLCAVAISFAMGKIVRRSSTLAAEGEGFFYVQYQHAFGKSALKRLAPRGFWSQPEGFVRRFGAVFDGFAPKSVGLSGFGYHIGRPFVIGILGGVAGADGACGGAMGTLAACLAALAAYTAIRRPYLYVTSNIFTCGLALFTAFEAIVVASGWSGPSREGMFLFVVYATLIVTIVTLVQAIVERRWARNFEVDARLDDEFGAAADDDGDTAATAVKIAGDTGEFGDLSMMSESVGQPAVAVDPAAATVGPDDEDDLIEPQPVTGDGDAGDVPVVIASGSDSDEHMEDGAAVASRPISRKPARAGGGSPQPAQVERPAASELAGSTGDGQFADLAVMSVSTRPAVIDAPQHEERAPDPEVPELEFSSEEPEEPEPEPEDEDCSTQEDNQKMEL